MTAEPRPVTAADPSECDRFLAAHPEIEAVDIGMVDLHGIVRGKIVRRHELMSIYREGRHLPGSLLGLDTNGEDVDGTGLVWTDGDADRRAWPVPGTLVPMPWTVPPRAQVLLSMHHLDASPVACDPRAVLRRQTGRLAADGFTGIAAFELEFYLLDAAEAAQGRIMPARLPLDGVRADAIRVYGLDDLDRLEPFMRDLYRGAAAQNLPLETLISEYAPGQFELTLHHQVGIERAADDLIMAKRLVKGVARRHGMLACFMAKPFSDKAGSGMHMHVSLGDGAGANLFADQDGGFAPRLKHAVSGLLNGIGESMLIFAPHANSWRRFASASYAPVTPNWGINNRSVAVRVPAGTPENRHIEHRVAGVDANPFLVAASVIHLIRHGLATKRDPGEPVTGNGYLDNTSTAPGIPRYWPTAIEAAERSEIVRESLGDQAHHVLVALAKAEYQKVAGDVPPLDYTLYLDPL